MVTAPDLPFKLRVIKRFPNISCQEGVLFSTDVKEIWKEGIITLSIEENDDIEILFDSEDANARLYLEALDIVPIDDRKVLYDEKEFWIHPW